jgi:hypothetical protein
LFFKSFETQAAPLPLLTRTATVHTNLGGDPDSKSEKVYHFDVKSGKVEPCLDLHREIEV